MGRKRGVDSLLTGFVFGVVFAMAPEALASDVSLDEALSVTHGIFLHIPADK